MPLLSGRQLHRSFGSEPALTGASAFVEPGEVVAVTGRSGAGKSTLLHCLGGLLRPSSGQVLFRDRRLDGLSERQLSQVRRENFGFVLQFGELLPELTLLENVALSLRLLGEGRREARRRSLAMLERLEIDAFADRSASEVSGGQAQRAAVARALIHGPKVVFADEPTGSLDRVTADLVLSEFLALARERSTAVLLVTHDADVANRADRHIEMHAGAVVAPEHV